MLSAAEAVASYKTCLRVDYVTLYASSSYRYVYYDNDKLTIVRGRGRTICVVRFGFIFAFCFTGCVDFFLEIPSGTRNLSVFSTMCAFIFVPAYTIPAGRVVPMNTNQVLF